MRTLHSTLLFFLLLAGSAIVVIGCGNDNRASGTPDISALKIPLQIVRYDQALFNGDSATAPQRVAKLFAEHPQFSELYAGLLADADTDTLSPQGVVTKFAQSPIIRALYDTCQVHYASLQPIQGDLEQLLKHYKYYFPNLPTPIVYTYLSEYTLGVFTYGDSLLGIGLDFFLGENYAGYDVNFFPNYIKRTMTTEHIIPKAAETLASNVMGKQPSGKFLDHIIANGKMTYLMSLLLPHTPDSLLMGYTAEQMKWCQTNEQQMWSYFVADNLLYKTDIKEYRKYIDYSPNSPGMPPQAPGKTGNWIGWQIVKAYMQQHPTTSLQALIAFGDAQKFLEAAKYKPKR